ncbi:hypothetical protein K469DRAFT_588918 [Zopfia rhizophila CBS 207.26]|uniref:PNPLA domain-containing protein n=1 Tax=Zopfia rhizophila CBS 207.26 TaxID=1314779 RepID=A0A6A6DU43_9PEZI|nr:hypothetical protein K469DRAFT_588918 [Zopfia rhizophila CBS 207.26]
MSEYDLRLLALDGGGVRGLSTLQIVKQLMDTINPESPPSFLFYSLNLPWIIDDVDDTCITGYGVIHNLHSLDNGQPITYSHV